MIVINVFESLPSLLNIILTYRYVFTIVYDFVISFFCVASILSIYLYLHLLYINIYCYHYYDYSCYLFTHYLT